MKGATVYRLYDESGTLLYVGQSMYAAQRLATHEDKPWWPQVATAAMEHFDNRNDALVREAELIDENRPPNNRHVADPRAMAERHAARDACDEELIDVQPAVEPTTPSEHIAAAIKRAHQMHDQGYDASATREIAFAQQIAEAFGEIAV